MHGTDRVICQPRGAVVPCTFLCAHVCMCAGVCHPHSGPWSTNGGVGVNLRGELQEERAAGFRDQSPTERFAHLCCGRKGDLRNIYKLLPGFWCCCSTRMEIAEWVVLTWDVAPWVSPKHLTMYSRWATPLGLSQGLPASSLSGALVDQNAQASVLLSSGFLRARRLHVHKA